MDNDLTTNPQGIFVSQNFPTVPREGIPFQDVRDHMQTYVLSGQDWENVERILSWFQNSTGDQTVTRAEFFAVYDENQDRCTDPIDSSDFLGKDLPRLSGSFHAEFECDDFENHETHYQNFEQSATQYAKDLEGLYYDFSLWQAIGTYLQNEFKIPPDRQIRMVQSCEAPDEREELFYLHLRKDLEKILRDWFAPISQGRNVDRNMIGVQFFYMTEVLMGYLRDNPEMSADTLFEVLSFFKENPRLFSDAETISSHVFPELYPERQHNSFVTGAYTQAARDRIAQKLLPQGIALVLFLSPDMIFNIAWHWETGMQDLFYTIDQNVRAFGSYTITTPHERYLFSPAGNIQDLLAD